MDTVYHCCLDIISLWVRHRCKRNPFVVSRGNTTFYAGYVVVRVDMKRMLYMLYQFWFIDAFGWSDRWR